MSQSTKFQNGFELIRNGNVEIQRDFSTGGAKAKPVARMIINDSVEHTFSPDSRVSRALADTSEQSIQERIQGGSFFLKDDKLVSFKDGNRKHFVHTDDSIHALIDTIGHTTDKKHMGGFNRLNTRELKLQNVWSDVELEIPGYQTGNEFNSELSFGWSPFEAHVSSTFRLIRLICTNGMMGTTNFLNTNIPLVNRWEEHLDIASKQIQNKVTGMMEDRFNQMIHQHATVRDVQRVMAHIQKRADVIDNRQNESTFNMLLNTAQMIDPKTHVGDKYLSSAFEDGRIGDRIASHISMHTLWNLITELSSHSKEGDDSSDFALDRFANEILFDRIDDGTLGLTGDVKLDSNFNNVEAALMYHQI